MCFSAELKVKNQGIKTRGGKQVAYLQHRV